MVFIKWSGPPAPAGLFGKADLKYFKRDSAFIIFMCSSRRPACVCVSEL